MGCRPGIDDFFKHPFDAYPGTYSPRADYHYLRHRVDRKKTASPRHRLDFIRPPGILEDRRSRWSLGFGHRRGRRTGRRTGRHDGIPKEQMQMQMQMQTNLTGMDDRRPEVQYSNRLLSTRSSFKVR